MFNLGILRFEVKCLRPRTTSSDNSSPTPMTPKYPKTSKSTTSIPSTLSWLSMAETLSCKKRSSTSSSSPFRPRHCNKVSLTSGNNNHQETMSTPFVHSKRVDLPTEGNGHIGNGRLPLDYLQAEAQSQHENEELLLTVTQLRLELEHLKDILLEQQRIDAEKDKLIERLTSAVQGLHFDIPPRDSDRNGGRHQGRQRSFSAGSPLHLEPQKFAELRLSPGGIEYDDDDLV